MADLEFVDPATGAALGSHAFGTVAAGSASASWAVRLRYKWGQSGSGLNSNALLLEVSDDGGVTYSTDFPEFTLQVTAVVNTPSDPLFLGATTAARRTTRLDLPALRAGCAYDLAVIFSPTLRTGTTTTTYTWRLGVAYNDSYRVISLNPDAPTGVLTGLGDVTVYEWITAPTLANDTDKVTLGNAAYIFAGTYQYVAGADVTLNQDDGASATLTSGKEYIALISAGGSGMTTTKGVMANAGSAVAPAYPQNELPVAVVTVPYGGVIVASTLVAVSGRCLVIDAGGRVVTVQPGRAHMPGYFIQPSTVQTLTCPANSTSIVYLSEQGVANLVAGVPLAEVTTDGSDITALTDTRVLLYQGQQSKLLAQVEGGGNTINDAVLVGTYTLTSNADADGFGIVNLNRSGTKTDAASVEVVFGRSIKRPCRAAATSNVASLSGEQTVDGIALTDGQRVLLTNQSTASQIGSWYVRTGAWERPLDNDDSYQVYAGFLVVVTEGTNRGLWVQTGVWGTEVYSKLVSLP